MLFADVVAASAEVAATRSRTAKATAIADLLGRAGGNEVRPVTAWLAGDTLQGRLGVGWRTLTRLAHDPAASPRLTVSDVDRALTELAGTTGTGSAARREAVVERLLTGPPPTNSASSSGC